MRLLLKPSVPLILIKKKKISTINLTPKSNLIIILTMKRQTKLCFEVTSINYCSDVFFICPRLYVN